MTTDLRALRSYDDALARFEWQLPKHLNIAEVIERHARHERVALHSVSEAGVASLSFAGLAEAAQQASGTLAERGIGPRSMVAVVLPNTLECAVVTFAALRLGAVVAALRLHPDPSAYRSELRLVRPAIVVTDRLRSAQISAQTDAPVLACGLETLLARSPGTPPLYRTAADDPAMIGFTSGSTGEPKAVVLPHRSFLVALPTLQLYSGLGPREGDIFFNSLGWATTGGLRPMVFPAWHFGCTVAAPRTPLTAAAVCRAVTGLGVTCAYLMPNLLRELWQLRDAIGEYDWSALRAVTYAGEAVGPALHDWLVSSLGVELNPYYGANEIAFAASSCERWFSNPPGATGRLVPGRRVEILDEGTLEPVADGEVGILSVVRGDPGLAVGYLSPDGGDVSFPADAMAGERFLTGDLVRLDQDGALYYVGRRGQVIHAADGTLVPPVEVEDAALACDGVVEAVALQSVADPRAPVTLCAMLGTAEPSVPAEPSVTAVAIATALNERFAGRLRVGRVVVLDRMPRTASTRKVNRPALRDELDGGGAAVILDVEVRTA
jgi:acetyl-CoA synthetase